MKKIRQPFFWPKNTAMVSNSMIKLYYRIGQLHVTRDNLGGIGEKMKENRQPQAPEKYPFDEPKYFRNI